MDFLKIFGRESVASKDIAKERLRLILVHDRANVSPKFLEMIKSQLIDMISNYMEIDEDGLELKMTRIDKDKNVTVPALVANIPIKKVKHLSRI
ncbi:MAG: cell division topological specificity factor MinE [Tepidanaerobacteraceae bacterium]|nr:cell division topological specificity factor MinE [Tepidanaerobacter sp.]HQE05553.1 cell division topological specificity factor MinE [Tepidanaerobacteraceae bacterium]